MKLIELCDNCKLPNGLVHLAKMNLEQARTNMIESQVRTWEVLDQTVLDLLSEVKREEFVPEKYRDLAFADMEIPLGAGEQMLTPKLEARVVQELDVRKTDKVLLVGIGSGYVAALLGKLGGQVVAVERNKDFVQAASRKLAGHGISNVHLIAGNGADGWRAQAPYDVILLTGSVPAIPDAIKSQLAVAGRLLAVVGEPPVMTAQLVTRVSDLAFNSVGLFETSIPPLRDVKQPERFVF